MRYKITLEVFGGGERENGYRQRCWHHGCRKVVEKKRCVDQGEKRAAVARSKLAASSSDTDSIYKSIVDNWPHVWPNGPAKKPAWILGIFDPFAESDDLTSHRIARGLASCHRLLDDLYQWGTKTAQEHCNVTGLEDYETYEIFFNPARKQTLSEQADL